MQDKRDRRITLLVSQRPLLFMEKSRGLGSVYLEQEAQARNVGRIQLLPKLKRSLHGRCNLKCKDSHSPVRGDRGGARGGETR